MVRKSSQYGRDVRLVRMHLRRHSVFPAKNLNRIGRFNRSRAAIGLCRSRRALPVRSLFGWINRKKKGNADQDSQKVSTADDPKQDAKESSEQTLGGQENLLSAQPENENKTVTAEASELTPETVVPHPTQSDFTSSQESHSNSESDTQRDAQQMGNEEGSGPQWWIELPYICVLKSGFGGGLFMVDIGLGREEKFSVIGFEDPKEAHVTNMCLSDMGTERRFIPFRQRQLDYLELGVRPATQGDWKGGLEMTWLSPKEFQDFLDKGKVGGAVIPAGTVQDEKVKGRNKAEGVLECIREASAMSDWDEQMDQQTPSSDSELFQPSQKSNTQRQSTDEPISPPGSLIDGSFLTNIPNSDAVRHQMETGEKLDSINAESGTINDPDTADPINVQRLSTRGGEGISRSKQVRWWMDLDRLFVPKLKKPGEGSSSVEINLSFVSEYEDFRVVLFEDRNDARDFLGVFGKQMPDGSLVGIGEYSPARFRDQYPDYSVEDILVLSKGSLILRRDMDYSELVASVMMGQYMTSKEKNMTIEEMMPKFLKGPAGGELQEVRDEMEDLARNLLEETFQRSKEGDAESGSGLNVNGLMDDLIPGTMKDTGKFSDLENRMREVQDNIAGLKMDLENRPSADGEFSLNGAAQSELPSIEAESFEPVLGDDDVSSRDGSSESKRIGSTTQDTSGTESSPKLGTGPNAEGGTESGTESGTEPRVKSSTSGRKQGSRRVLYDETVKKPTTQEEEDELYGLKIVYPRDQSTTKGDKPNVGPRWFEALSVIFMPQYVDKMGRPVSLAFKDEQEGRTLVVGFQNKYDAKFCVDVMSGWEEMQGVDVGMVPISPKGLLDMCESQENVDPIVLRRGSVPLELGMMMNEFYEFVGWLAEIQKANLPTGE